jgi:hypothetical protein
VKNDLVQPYPPAIAMELIPDGKTKMEMLKSRNITTHTYDEKTADKILVKIAVNYYPGLSALERTMNEMANAG